MPAEQINLSLKKKMLVYFYKSKQYVNYVWQRAKGIFNKFVDSPWFYLLIFTFFTLFLHKILVHANVILQDDDLRSLAFAEAGIIGASIAIVFSFSTFILQSTSDLFSTQYLNKFIEDKKEKAFFWLLVLLTVASFFTPIFIKKYVFEILVFIFLIAFYLIYNLYKGLRERINPETTLTKIKKDAVKHLRRVNGLLKQQANIQNKIFEYKGENKDYSLAIQYKANPSWHVNVIEDVKYLFEIGLRLLSKNEINSSNLTIQYIRDIFIEHLIVRNKNFIRVPADLWGSYTFEDEGFTTKILEYLQTISDRLIQDKRKENIYFLLKIYENILNNSLAVEFADKELGSTKGNPLLYVILAYYLGFLDSLSIAKENDWKWESIKSISTVSGLILQKTNDYFVCSQINQTINKIIISCIGEKQEAFVKEIVNIYFRQIQIAWDKYEYDQVFWKNLFTELKKSTLLLAVSSGNLSLSVSDLYINFHTWQVNAINWIIEQKDEEQKGKSSKKYIQLLERWSDFLLDLAREIGLQNNQLGLPIIQSVDNNIRILYGIHKEFPDIDLKNIYRTQFNTLSWYFHKTEKVEESFILNLEQVLEILIKEINYNFTKNIFEVGSLVKLYIRLIEQHFEKVTLGYGYNHPRVIIKLVHLGLILNKHKKPGEEAIVLAKINELNKKYLELNKEFFEMKKKEPNLMGPDEHQLCKELHDLENDVFSYNRGSLMDLESILKEEITEVEWNDFTKKIKYCEGIEYKTVSMF